MTSITLDLDELSKEQILTLIEMGLIGQTKIKFVSPKKPEPRLAQKAKLLRPIRRFHESTANKIESIVHLVNAGKKPMTLDDIRKHNIYLASGGTTTAIVNQLKRDKRVKVDKPSRCYVIYPRGYEIPKEPELEVHTMRRKRPMSKYNLFMSQKLRGYIKAGHRVGDAFRMAVADWTKFKTPVPTPTEAEKVEFPRFESVKPAFHDILKNMLQNLAHTGKAMTFNTASYPLGIWSLKQYREFLEEAVTNNEAIKMSLGLDSSKNFKTKNFKLCFE